MQIQTKNKNKLINKLFTNKLLKIAAAINTVLLPIISQSSDVTRWGRSGESISSPELLQILATFHNH